MDNEINKLLKYQIKQMYPTHLDDYFIELAMEYCEKNSDSNVESMLESSSAELVDKSRLEEPTTFSVE